MGKRNTTSNTTTHFAVAKRPHNYISWYTLCRRIVQRRFCRTARAGVEVQCDECMDTWVAWKAVFPNKSPTVRRFRAWRKQLIADAEARGGGRSCNQP